MNTLIFGANEKRIKKPDSFMQRGQPEENRKSQNLTKLLMISAGNFEALLQCLTKPRIWKLIELGENLQSIRIAAVRPSMEWDACS